MRKPVDAKEFIRKRKNLITFGNGRSYGDSALSERVIFTKRRNYILAFDSENGTLTCQSGVLLSDILETFVPKGWFLPVTPGTKFITVGGAIAADVHGKNHHKNGCFSEFVEEFDLMLPSGDIVKVKKGEELFYATCGGMGLTGIILDVKLRLIRVSSPYLKQITIKAKNLSEVFDMFEKYAHIDYSVAWVDCLAQGSNRGRSIFIAGEFLRDGCFENITAERTLKVPKYTPGMFINKLSIKLFNKFYFNKFLKEYSEQKVFFEKFFYPLDSINNWNRLYGRKGFLQYQFILPKRYSFEGIDNILWEVAKSDNPAFLSVLKLYGKSNRNYLSFPIEGYSLAMDFKISTTLETLLSRLDKIVMKYGGRIYLAKDARMGRELFESGYPEVDRFRAVRKFYGADKKFSSLQSKRLAL